MLSGPPSSLPCFGSLARPCPTLRLRGGAEVGKGDPRWIVQDREDGRNCGSWHWEERDMMPWSRQQLAERVKGVRSEMSNFEGLSGYLEVVNVTSMTGDCVIHLRKGRLWPLCDIRLVLSLEGTCSKGSGSEIPLTAEVVFPEVTVDDRNELEIEARVLGTGEERAAAGRWLRKDGTREVVKAVQAFLDDLNAKASSSNSDSPPRDTEKVKEAAEKMAKVNKVIEEPKTPTTVDQGGDETGDLTIVEEFSARPDDIWDCLMNAGRVNAYTRSSDAMIESKPGGRFSILSGLVTGGYEEVVVNEHLRGKWRMNCWAPGKFSNLRITIRDRGAHEGCTLELLQDGIPKREVQNTERFWKERIFKQIKLAFGYGSVSGAPFSTLGGM
ncbi:hypothetical protein GUITHDRAFT_90426 [Guillardia theta CCMP2712]|uniref:Activator of Hsp90 ATPase AHSA1-like N-terminal domain-containing protein n=2 Tax=Guillardia theta TaxID=55529 RepID=L1IFF1_GUITC|nr:hypothetical protein GUITHDRAFT_90426 [Guillardia theta CCMP2712]EKX34644.1 hypothetical protein GUITHDRAFT_90426 [Guillardia theta CCMP2712]|eukprot:XP_005821624.1 hypothetical protein GUITHDRAFT_90426 [Guillardia theta CCMP2712]